MDGLSDAVSDYRAFALANLENFVIEKSGKRCKKSGRHQIKSGNREIVEEVNFFPVSAPGMNAFCSLSLLIFPYFMDVLKASYECVLYNIDYILLKHSSIWKVISYCFVYSTDDDLCIEKLLLNFLTLFLLFILINM